MWSISSQAFVLFAALAPLREQMPILVYAPLRASLVFFG